MFRSPSFQLISMVLPIMLFASCAGTIFGPKSKTMMDAPRKVEISADASTATLVVFRPTHLGKFNPINIYLDKEFIGETRGQTWFASKIQSGTHYVIASGMSNNNVCAKIDFEPGKVYYLFEFITPAFIGVYSGFTGSTPDNFQKELGDMTCLIRTDNKDLPVLKEDVYKQIVQDYENDLKVDPEKHKDTRNLKGY